MSAMIRSRPRSAICSRCQAARAPGAPRRRPRGPRRRRDATLLAELPANGYRAARLEQIGAEQRVVDEHVRHSPSVLASWASTGRPAQRGDDLLGARAIAASRSTGPGLPFNEDPSVGLGGGGRDRKAPRGSPPRTGRHRALRLRARPRTAPRRAEPANVRGTPARTCARSVTSAVSVAMAAPGPARPRRAPPPGGAAGRAAHRAEDFAQRDGRFAQTSSPIDARSRSRCTVARRFDARRVLAMVEQVLLRFAPPTSRMCPSTLSSSR